MKFQSQQLTIRPAQVDDGEANTTNLHTLYIKYSL